MNLASSKKAPNPNLVFRLKNSSINGTSSVKAIHDRHQAPILKNASNAPKKGIKEEIDLTHKKNDSNELKKGSKGEINLTHNKDTKGDSASKSSYSSSEDSDGSSNKGSCSKTSINNNEEMSVANGKCQCQLHSSSSMSGAQQEASSGGEKDPNLRRMNRSRGILPGDSISDPGRVNLASVANSVK
jgi:hypothetical protein